MTRRNKDPDTESAHLPHAIMLVLVERKPKPKKKRAGAAGGESARARHDRPRRQMGGGLGLSASVADPWWTRSAARQAEFDAPTGGVSGVGPLPGSPATVPGQIPAVQMAGLSQGPLPLAGGRLLTEAQRVGPGGVPLPERFRGPGLPHPPPLPAGALQAMQGPSPSEMLRDIGAVRSLSSAQGGRTRGEMQAGGGMPAEASMVGPRGMPLPVQHRGPGLPQAPVSAADVQRARLLALRARGGV